MHTHQYTCGGGEGWGSMLLIKFNLYADTSVHLGRGGGAGAVLLSEITAYAHTSVHLRWGWRVGVNASD